MFEGLISFWHSIVHFSTPEVIFYALLSSLVGVVMAAGGYPDSPTKGDEITGLPPATEDARVFHAGTADRDGKVVTSGGRVLCVTALGETVKIAQQRAYQMLEPIRFDGMQYRRDIGYRAIGRKT